MMTDIHRLSDDDLCSLALDDAGWLRIFGQSHSIPYVELRLRGAAEVIEELIRRTNNNPGFGGK
jgi:hypothetical protein